MYGITQILSTSSVRYVHCWTIATSINLLPLNNPPSFAQCHFLRKKFHLQGFFLLYVTADPSIIQYFSILLLCTALYLDCIVCLLREHFTTMHTIDRYWNHRSGQSASAATVNCKVQEDAAKSICSGETD